MATVHIDATDKLETAVRAVIDHSGIVPTNYQRDIIDWAINGTGNAIVMATPGSGKSTSLEFTVVGINSVHDPRKRPSILVLAFNKSIADAMNARLGQWPNAKAKTLNGLGFGVMMQDSRFKGCVLKDDKTLLIARAVAGFDQMGEDDQDRFHMTMPAVNRLVSLFKSFGYGAIRPMPIAGDVFELAAQFDVEFPEDVPDSYVLDLLFRTFERSNKTFAIVDFDDMLYLPILLRLPFPTYNKFVMCDESQDLNVIQIEMMRKLCSRGGRALFVGDSFQAIYNFRGADPAAMMTIIEKFDTVELPLSISWRCPRSVVAIAAKINPAIEPAPNAKEGEVRNMTEEEFLAAADDGDMVLCRTTAPLVKHVWEIIRSGRKAFVKGSDIGVGLKSLADKITKKKLAGSPWDQIRTYADAQLAKCKDDGKRSKLADRFDTLAVLAEGASDMKGVKSRINSIFAEDKAGVAFMTVHKAKGLEAPNVFILHPELMPHPMAKTEDAQRQEMNIKYVAITRAISTLTIVKPSNPLGRRKSVEI